VRSGATYAATALAAALVALAGCTTPRPPAPPPDARVKPPLGAIDVNELYMPASSLLEESLEESLAEESAHEFDADGDGIREYAVLALSGGGSSGAYGAGLLCGWTVAGTRPDFKVVSGVSTGSLQSTFAFLGPDYDDELREIYTIYETRDIYRPRKGLGKLFSDALNDTWPLEELIDHYVTDEVLAAVATKHDLGHRLYVGTVNFDTAEFTIWDLGAVATSGRDDALAHYRHILLASCSIPVFFPPVYFAVESDDDETYYEMHVDGGTYANVFFRDFMLDLDDALEDSGRSRRNSRMTIYLVQNGLVAEEHGQRAVPGTTMSIAATTIEDIFTVSGTSSLFRVYMLAGRNNIGFRLAAIPQGTGIDIDPTSFDRKRMQKLFDLAYEQAAGGYEWLDAPPFLDPDEILVPPDAPADP
jgi:hypothetical protein